jgi:outer membrane receptor protein involved in Fe transport
MEINLVSDFDGPFNYTVGAYQIDNRNDNVYLVQTAGSQMMTSFGNHPYSDFIQTLGFPDWSAKGGLGFYSDMLDWLDLAGNALACQGLVPGTCDPSKIGDFNDQTAKQAAYPNFTVPWELGGVINDQNVDDTSRALYGEMYFDFSDDTKLTIGARYQEDDVTAVTFNQTGATGWMANGGWLFENRDEMSFSPGGNDVTTKADDQFSYKLALQHNLSDDVMVYGSYTTANKAGGVNAGANPTTYEPEEAGVLDLGLKSILMDGAMLLNMNVFNAQNDGFLVAAVVNTGTENKNIDAEFTGFEGNMMVFLSENTKLEANWLFLDHEVVSDTMLIDYLNPTGSTGILGAAQLPGTGGLITSATFNDDTVWYKSAGYNCSAPGLYTAGCSGEVGIAQSVKGNNLPGSADTSYGLSLTTDFPSSKGVTSTRVSYRYTGEADLSVFNMERMKLEARDSWDLLVRYVPNTDDWYAGMYIKNIADDQALNALRESSNVGGGSLLGSFTDPRTFGIEFGAQF